MGNKCDFNCCNNKNIQDEKDLEVEKPFFEEPAPPAKNTNNNNENNENNNENNENDININNENIINTESKKKLKSKKKSNVNEREPSNLIEETKKIFKFNESIKLNEYSHRILELINAIRDRPQSYIEIIKENTENIEASGKNSEKIIFKKKVKVFLNKGYEAFSDAMEYLKNVKSMEPLILNEDINIDLPENIDEFKNPNFIKEKANELIKNGKKIDFYFRDLIKYPDVSVLMMIVDDNEKSNGNKRKILLNPKVKFIGINYKFVGKYFIAHFSFQKE